MKNLQKMKEHLTGVLDAVKNSKVNLEEKLDATNIEKV